MNEKEYHRARRMFFVINNELIIAPVGLGKSHFEWLQEQGYSDEKTKEIFENNLRGVVNPDGNVRFYVGENFEVNEKIEKEFFKFLPELVDKLEIKMEAEIGGGIIKQKVGTFWPAKKVYGKVRDFIK